MYNKWNDLGNQDYNWNERRKLSPGIVVALCMVLVISFLALEVLENRKSSGEIRRYNNGEMTEEPIETPVYEDDFISVFFNGCERHRYIGVDTEGTFTEYSNGISLTVRNKTDGNISVADKEVKILNPEQGEYISSGYSYLPVPANDSAKLFYNVPEMDVLTQNDISMTLWVFEYSENYEKFGDYLCSFEVSTP